MNVAVNLPKRTRWQRFMERGGLSALGAVLTAPFAFYQFRYGWHFELFYAAVFTFFASVVFAQFVLLLGLTLFGVYLHLFHRGLCPACHQRGLRAGIRVSEPTDNPRLRRVSYARSCTACGRQLLVFEDGTYEEIPEV